MAQCAGVEGEMSTVCVEGPGACDRLRCLERKVWRYGIYVKASSALVGGLSLVLVGALLVNGQGTCVSRDQIVMRDASGMVRAKLGLREDGLPSLEFYDGSGDVRLWLLLTPEGEAKMRFCRREDGVLLYRVPVSVPEGTTDQGTAKFSPVPGIRLDTHPK